MLQEFTHLESPIDQRARRWFRDDYFDLYLWYDTAGALNGWQLCYGKPAAERALTWRDGAPLVHEAIDDGETSPGRLKKSPVLQADGAFHSSEIAAKFSSAIAGLNDRDVQTVLVQIQAV